MSLFSPLISRLHRDCATFPFPGDHAPKLPDLHGGRPELTGNLCSEECHLCLTNCPTQALKHKDGAVQIDLGRCLFCGECITLCPHKVIAHSADYKMSTNAREDLFIEPTHPSFPLANALPKKKQRLFKRSLRLRQISAGGCNACEADLNVLSTIGWDLGRFGIQYVASPRHADGLVLTGPVSKGMETALHKTWAAIPEPKIAIAVGSCAISGGLFREHSQVLNEARTIPIDLYIPGCPPHPLTILDGLLRLLGQIQKS